MSQLLDSLLSPTRAEQCRQSDAYLMVGLGQTIAAAIAPRNVLSPAAIRLAQYEAALKRMDWGFDHAEGNAWRKGKTELERLRAERAAIDPTGEVWRRHAPEAFRGDLRVSA